MSLPRVVVVDSHERVLEQLAARLGQETGLDLCGYASVSGLEDLIAKCNPDVVLIDPYRGQSYNLPLLQNIALTYPGIRVIVLTAVADTSTRIAMKRLGVKAVLEKGIDFDEVIRAIVDCSGQ